MKRADSAIRVSITADTTVEELDSFVEALTDGIKKSEADYYNSIRN